MTHRLYLGLGSNIGDREGTIRRALNLIGQHIGTIEKTSSFYETQPWGFESQHLFITAVAQVSTLLSPHECLVQTQQIERQLGRKQKSTNGQYHDRTIDIDLLLYDDLHIESPDLVIPHPHIWERDFVRIPLKEINPALCS